LEKGADKLTANKTTNTGDEETHLARDGLKGGA
jgi:hypothetical protein